MLVPSAAYGFVITKSLGGQGNSINNIDSGDMTLSHGISYAWKLHSPPPNGARIAVHTLHWRKETIA